ncbi:hypothetical protein TNCV_141551 [Trichonephila clavipes]|nr:hypothetical protein TNCV_141551 [Trichonephila clavipes]
MYKGGAIKIVIEKGGASIESLRSTDLQEGYSASVMEMLKNHLCGLSGEESDYQQYLLLYTDKHLFDFLFQKCCGRFTKGVRILADSASTPSFQYAVQKSKRSD